MEQKLSANNNSGNKLIIKSINDLNCKSDRSEINVIKR